MLHSWFLCFGCSGKLPTKGVRFTVSLALQTPAVHVLLIPSKYGFGIWALEISVMIRPTELVTILDYFLAVTIKIVNCVAPGN